MLEFSTVSASSYDPSVLATKLNEKSAEGWSIVSIVSTGGDITAFLSREVAATSEAAEPEAAVVAEAVVAEAVTPEPAVVEPTIAEPAGWALAPEPASQPQPAAQPEPEPAPTPAPQPEPAPAPAPATPAVPSGWYADPSGRFELRYWDGSAWTEHVARAGQQFTDPPVA
jgi:outer membrane biosynthesis protein TonB